MQTTLYLDHIQIFGTQKLVTTVVLIFIPMLQLFYFILKKLCLNFSVVLSYTAIYSVVSLLVQIPSHTNFRYLYPRPLDSFDSLLDENSLVLSFADIRRVAHISLLVANM